MATIFRPHQSADTGSGGKILRGRRVTAPASPYLRPNSPPPTPENNRNWLVGFVSPATRMIARGAGKLISSVFGPGNSPSSSSASSDDDFSSRRAEEFSQNASPSQASKLLDNEPQLIAEKSEAKLEIERLVMQETFSREECDRLTNIIHSRVVVNPTMKVGQDVRQEMMPDRKAAIMEARKWLEGKKSESCSKSELDHGTLFTNSFMLPCVTEREVSSPVDVAKSYMQAQPPWESPYLGRIGFKTPSPAGMQLFKEESPRAIDSHSLSSSKALKRKSNSIASWNLMEEIRRVRAKATEDILGSTAVSRQTDLSIELEHESGKISSVDDKAAVQMTGMGNESNSSLAPQSVDAKLATVLNTSDSCPENPRDGFALPATLVSKAIHDRPENEPLSISQAILVQDLEETPLDRGEVGIGALSAQPHTSDSVSRPHNGLQDSPKEIFNSGPSLRSSEEIETVLRSDALDFCGLNNANMSNQQLSCCVGQNIQVKASDDPLQLPDAKENHSVDNTTHNGHNLSQTDMNGIMDGVTANGFPSIPSVSAGLDIKPEPNPRSSEERESNPKISSLDKMASEIPVEVTSEHLGEASVEVPITDETGGIANGSQSSSSRHREELSKIQPEPNVTNSSVAKSRGRVEKPQRKKISRNNRRGKGRG